MTHKTSDDLLADLLAVKLAAGGYSGVTVTRGGLPDNTDALAVSVIAQDGEYDEAVGFMTITADISARALDLQQAESLAQLSMHLLHRTYGYTDPDSSQNIMSILAQGSPSLQARLSKGPYAVYGFKLTAFVTR